MKLDNTYLLFKKRNLLFWISLPVLYILSLFYWITVSVLKFLYRVKLLPSYRPKFKVISVGNITLGGTGKTPLVEWLVNCLNENQRKTGVIIRGYKRSKAVKSGAISKKDGYLEIGDEASMLRENLGNIKMGVGRDKVKSARDLEGSGCEAFILDDGFQHWRLKRDLDIVTIDCSEPFLSQKLLPLGRLREPFSALNRANIIVLTKTDLSQNNSRNIKEAVRSLNPKALIVSSVYQPICFHDLRTDACFPVNSDKFKDKGVFVLSGIANPIYFDNLISQLRLKVKRELIYPDHYEYKQKDLTSIKQLAKEMKVDTIVTTHKDAVRLRYILNFSQSLNVFYLKIRLKVVESEKELHNRILSVFNS